jgi:hypothetical protein
MRGHLVRGSREAARDAFPLFSSTGIAERLLPWPQLTLFPWSIGIHFLQFRHMAQC